MARRKTRELPAGLTEDGLEALLAGATTAEDVEAVFRRIKKALVEQMLRGELTAHLGYPEGGVPPSAEANVRNGTSAKTVLTEEGALALDIPRDGRARSRRSWCRRTCAASGVRPEGALALRAGSPCASCRRTWKSVPGARVGRRLTAVNDAVLEDVQRWQQRPLERRGKWPWSSMPSGSRSAMRPGATQGGLSRPRRGRPRREKGRPGHRIAQTRGGLLASAS